MKECNQCGKCCVKYGGSGGLSVNAEEIESWELFRPHIAEYVAKGEVWVNPKTGLTLTQCPWLEREKSSGLYTCSIYFDRPEDCRHYPTTIAEMVRDECEMIEVKDLNDERKAQVVLDKLMMDSRPPYLD